MVDFKSLIKPLLIGVLFLTTPSLIKAQEQSQINYTGLLRASTSFGAGFMTAQSLQNAYLSGDLEYYINQRISIRGEGHYFFNSLNNPNSPLVMNHQMFSGALFHFLPDKPLDIYVGFMPGLAYSQSIEYPCEECLPLLAIEPSKRTFNPLVSGLVGLNYYATKAFHFFINARYLNGKHLSDNPPLSLNEFRFAFGLGINIGTKKVKS